jgi:polyisoprenoid-binding protein YceI
MSLETYDIDPVHSAAHFSVRHLMISNVKGEFTKVSGTLAYDPENVTAGTIDAVIDATTISTREPQRDAHLKSPDFFDVEKFPALTFKSTGVSQKDDTIEVQGDLTIHGITKGVVLKLDEPVATQLKDPWGNQRIGASATTKINRKDFGLVFNQTLDTGGLAIGDSVTITIDISAVKRAS